MTHLAEPIDSLPTTPSHLIRATLQWAAPDTCEVHLHEDLNGASIVGPDIEAYVYADEGRYQVDVWRRCEYATEAFRVHRTHSLYAAVELAIVSATGIVP